ncbi:MAG TPA: glycerol-3-phosphate 1-O-acyltransferase PlsY [Candidatus Dormibacteraeota bacterium]|nr:glycerol-3-phosphate 1-O-acyltransferase PlsY [Candidatus Dormibacteraeota bacterium]
MSGPLGAAALAVLGYLIGAMPVGVIVGRVVAGVDIRRHGSRRTGATNALRTLGARWAIVVFALDVAKGVGAVLLARALYQAGPPGSPEWVAAAAGIGAVAGHNWSVFIGFTGGRGVATAAGGLLAMAPLALAVVVPIVALVVWRTHYVSLGSLTAVALAIGLTAGLAATGFGSVAAVGYALAAGALVWTAHRDNIDRLRAGTERRIGERESVAGDGRS